MEQSVVGADAPLRKALAGMLDRHARELQGLIEHADDGTADVSSVAASEMWRQRALEAEGKVETLDRLNAALRGSLKQLRDSGRRRRSSGALSLTAAEAEKLSNIPRNFSADGSDSDENRGNSDCCEGGGKNTYGRGSGDAKAAFHGSEEAFLNRGDPLEAW